MYPKELQEQAVSGEESSAPASLQILAESVFIGGAGNALLLLSCELLNVREKSDV